MKRIYNMQNICECAKLIQGKLKHLLGDFGLWEKNKGREIETPSRKFCQCKSKLNKTNNWLASN